MRVVIAGMSSVGRQVLDNLSGDRGHEVVVVDLDEERCEQIAAEYDALVINGDATDPTILEKAQIRQAAAVVACTHSDPINTVIAILAHRQEVATIIVMLTTGAMHGALREIGVTDIVAPTMAAAAQIEAGLHGAQHTNISELVEGGLHLAEMRVGSSADGTTLGDHKMPKGVLPVARLRDEQMELARSDTELRTDDVVLALTESEKASRSAHSALD